MPRQVVLSAGSLSAWLHTSVVLDQQFSTGAVFTQTTGQGDAYVVQMGLRGGPMDIPPLPADYLIRGEKGCMKPDNSGALRLRVP